MNSKPSKFLTKQKPFIVPTKIDTSRKNRNTQTPTYAMYSVSSQERLACLCTNAIPSMRNIKSDQLTVLKTDTRKNYLNSRLNISPRSKYYYPEATSWRYGWLIEGQEN